MWRNGLLLQWSAGSPPPSFWNFSFTRRFIFSGNAGRSEEFRTVKPAEETGMPYSYRVSRFFPIDRDGQSTVKPGGFLGRISI
jgi:hypothetical protein